ncbi:MauE/DoxX family redox-associated membrane protein [Pelagicoccus sp. SDUM812002]|uniref:MauE/DoxX family redox-associated membrane protein n=1 Tax=Pelagicoccus sp. SDUM812002 TaxID=3041266 RepID=UPI00280F2D35|nr:MauE/DoxX family redox-associated membrane protein [Pelagicoccus sp. SDUM812002]MDQ8186406.1 MauE/DoxX family redox-associated membrane protein [Pelagicoccus sp. SDUM812002]
MSARVFSWILYAVVGLFFGIAAFVKVQDPSSFLSSLLTYQIFSYSQASVLAYFAPALEVVVAFCLVSGVWRRGAALLTIFMLLLFIGLVAQGMLRGLEMNCGCFGENQLQTTGDYLLKMGQNLVLLLAVAGAWLVETKSKGPEPSDG